jgi:hypothetical protein
MLNQAISLLDPHSLGMAITPALCMPPVNGRILSLRERDGRGTPPWNADLDHQSSFLGLGSLAAYVVQNGHSASVADVAKERYIPIFAYPTDWEKSAAACPIWLEGKIAGCLLAVSPHIEHFTRTRIDLLLDFTNMFSLALNREDFYDHSMIHLRYIPRPEKQQELLLGFRQRANNLMKQSMQEGHPYSTQEAEKEAWRRIEKELIDMGERDNPEDDAQTIY